MNFGKTESVALLACMALIGRPGVANGRQTVNLPGEDQVLKGEATTLFSVGVADGREHEAFSDIAGVGFDARANLYVLDRGNANVVVFDRSGRYVRTIGSKGQGPGEFALPVGLAVFPDGVVAVMDLGNGAISVFNVNGEYADIIHPDARLIQARPTMLLSPSVSHSILVAGSQMTMRPDAPPQISDTLPILRVRLGGDRGTTVVYRTINPGPRVNATAGRANRQEIRLSPPPEFTAQASWRSLPDGGLVVNSGVDYAITVVDGDGTTLATMRRPIRPRPVTDRDKAMIREQRRAQLESGSGMLAVTEVNGRRSFSVGGRGMPPQQIEQRLAQLEFAERIPVVRRLAVDDYGNVWVERDGGPGSDDYPIDILLPTGEYGGTVRGLKLPDAFGPYGMAASIESDDLGVQKVVVRQLPRN